MRAARGDAVEVVISDLGKTCCHTRLGDGGFDLQAVRDVDEGLFKRFVLLIAMYVSSRLTMQNKVKLSLCHGRDRWLDCVVAVFFFTLAPYGHQNLCRRVR